MRKRTCPDNDMPSLFDFDFENDTATEQMPVTTTTMQENAAQVKKTKPAATNMAKTAKPKPTAPVLPAALKALQGQIPVTKLLKACGKCTFTFSDYSNYVHYNGTDWVLKNGNGRGYRWQQSHSPSADIECDPNNYTRTLLHMTSNGVLWRSSARFRKDNIRDTAEPYKTVQVQRWRLCDRIATDEILYVLQDENIDSIIARTNPYLYRFITENGYGYNTTLLAQAPQLETLYKAGYAFAEQILKKSIRNTKAECFNRLCRPGHNPKEIFKTSKSVYTTLKNCDDLEIWDIYRKMDKFGKLTPDTIQQAYDNHYAARELENISEILGKKHDGKSVFTWDSLINYLNRIDQYEAISAVEGLQLLNDYLTSCSVLKMKPKTDGDSLKREHDVAARLVREHRNEEKKKQMENASHLTEKYNYSEEVFIIRGIKDYDDLIDEAKQQHNCVASFADKIAKGQSYIFVMREKNAPDRSLITIEIAPKTLDIRQKYLAYNKPIHNKAQSEFIDRWLKHCKGIAA